MQNLQSLQNIQTLGKGQVDVFDPSFIKVAGEKMLLQQVFTRLTPTIAGVVYDESKNKGSARDIQLGRCYLFDGSNDYVLLPAGLNVSISGSTIRIKGYITYTIDGRTIVGSGANVSVGQGGYVLQIIGGKLNVTLYQNASTSAHRSFTGSTTLSTNTVYAIDVTFTTTTCTMSINGIAETVTIGSATGTYGDASVRATIGARAEGAQSAYGGKIWGLEIYRDSVLQAFYKCDEQSGTTAYDSSGNSAHGTITNATLATFHSTQDVYSYQNEVGYSKPATVFIPRNEAIPTQDVLGNALTYTGQVPYNGILKSSNCILLNGTTQYGATGLNMNTLCQNTFSVDTIVSPTDGQGTTFVIFGSSDNAVFGTQGTDSNNGLGIYVLTTGKLAVLYKAGGNFARADTASVIFTDGAQTALRKFRFTLTAGSGITILEYINGAWVNLALDATNNGLFSTNSVVMSTFNHDVVGFIGAKNTAGIGYNFFGGKVAFLECLDVSGASLVQYKISCGVGLVLCDSSGNLRNGLWYNAPTWSTQDNYHLNIVDGFRSYLLLTGSGNYVTTGDLTGLDNDWSISFKLRPTVNTALQYPVGFASSSDKGIGITSGGLPFLYDGVSLLTSTGSAVPTTSFTTIGVTKTGTTYKLYINGVLNISGTRADIDITKLYLGIRGDAFGACGGNLFDFRVYSSTLSDADMLALHQLQAIATSPKILYNCTELSGNTLTDSSGNGYTGTITGSTTRVKVPAVNATTDVFGYPLTNPAGAYHNGAETLIDFTGGVASPVAVINAWETTWGFNTARTNPKFKRTLTLSSVDHRADRFLAYRETLSGSNLSKVQNYTATKAI